MRRFLFVSLKKCEAGLIPSPKGFAGKETRKRRLPIIPCFATTLNHNKVYIFFLHYPFHGITNLGKEQPAPFLSL